MGWERGHKWEDRAKEQRALRGNWDGFQRNGSARVNNQARTRPKQNLRKKGNPVGLIEKGDLMAIARRINQGLAASSGLQNAAQNHP
jgi:hypothetical protein